MTEKPEKQKAWLDSLCDVYKQACPCCLLDTEPRQQHDIDQWWAALLPKKSPIPDKLRGVYFMNGNQPENCITLEFGTWYPESRKLVVPVTGEMAWSTQNERTLQSSNLIDLVYVFYFNEDLTHAEIIPRMCKIPVPACLLEFHMDEDMEKSNGDGSAFIRRSSACCGKYRQKVSYTVQKVLDVDKKGKVHRVEPYYQDMMDITKTVCYVVPQKNADAPLVSRMER